MIKSWREEALIFEIEPSQQDDEARNEPLEFKSAFFMTFTNEGISRTHPRPPQFAFAARGSFACLNEHYQCST